VTDIRCESHEGPIVTRKALNLAKDFASGLTPYTDAERERDREIAERGQEVQAIRRRVLKTSQRYDQPGTPQTKRRGERIMGETEPID